MSINVKERLNQADDRLDDMWQKIHENHNHIIDMMKRDGDVESDCINLINQCNDILSIIAEIKILLSYVKGLTKYLALRHLKKREKLTLNLMVSTFLVKEYQRIEKEAENQE